MRCAQSQGATAQSTVPGRHCPKHKMAAEGTAGSPVLQPLAQPVQQALLSQRALEQLLWLHLLTEHRGPPQHKNRRHWGIVRRILSREVVSHCPWVGSRSRTGAQSGKGLFPSRPPVDDTASIATHRPTHSSASCWVHLLTPWAPADHRRGTLRLTWSSVGALFRHAC